MQVSYARTALRPLFPGMCFEAADGGTSTTRLDGERVLLSSGTRMVRGGRVPAGDLWAPIVFVLDGPGAGSYVLEPGWAVGERAGTREPARTPANAAPR